MIGRRVRHASGTEAADAIAGFTVANDVSMRDWQNRSLEWLQGKTWEHATPVGPWLVTPDEVGGTDPDLEIALRGRRRGPPGQPHLGAGVLAGRPGRLRQRVRHPASPATCSSPARPPASATACDPPMYLAPGQVVRTVIGHIGELENRCVPEAP